MRVTEQVVHVAENLLVGADEEHPEIVRLVADGVQRQRFLHIAPVDEAIQFPV